MPSSPSSTTAPATTPRRCASGCASAPDGPSWSLDHDALVDAASDEPIAVDADGDDPLFIMYTSGTTGLPKGALHTHDSVEWAVLTVLATADVRFLDRYLICLPLFHVGALNPLTVTIYRGGTVILMRQFDPERIWTIFRDEQVTVTLAVPAMLNFMLQTYRPDVHQPLQLRWIMSGAAPVPPSLIEEYAGLGLEIHQVYGLTETCGPACLISPDEALTRIGSTGKAFFHTDVRIVDDAGADVGADEPGEVLVRGRHIMAGYWNRPDETAATIRDGWLHTGDIAVRDADGFVFIRDRIKDMIISGGENIYPAEIEDVLLAHPRIVDVGGDRHALGEVGRVAAGRRRRRRRRPRRTHRPGALPGQAGPLQAAPSRRVHRRHPAQPDRQGAQTSAARAVPARRT